MSSWWTQPEAQTDREQFAAKRKEQEAAMRKSVFGRHLSAQVNIVTSRDEGALWRKSK